ncbi:MAG: ankyrin repeat protein [Cryomorphaceae bacterium]|jgi:ankyrin repeat protein
MQIQFFLILALSIVSPCLAEKALFFPVTKQNTFLADGSRLPKDSSSIGWSWLTINNNQGVWESKPSKGLIHPTLMILADGLDTRFSYEVFGCFSSDGANKKKRKFRPVRFGLTLSSIHTFASAKNKHLPWMISPKSRVGVPYGLEVLDGRSSTNLKNGSLNFTADGEQLISAKIGIAKASTDGTLPVFFADFPYDQFPGRARINGVWLRKVGKNSPIPVAVNPVTRLHLAIRSGDKVTIKRELDAGADVNVFDEDGLTPLFYASAADDSALVLRLLDQGADPNLSGQSIPPLTAAAMLPSVEIVSTLLSAGAEVRDKPYEKAEKLHRQSNPGFFHPVIAAIRAGSLPVLKLLLEQVPDLNIQSLVVATKGHTGNIMDEFPDPSRVYPSPFLVDEAMNLNQWELAAYLIEKGCDSVPVPHSRFFKDTHPSMFHYPIKSPKHGELLVKAVAAGEDGLPVIDALIRRGLSPVFNRKISEILRSVEMEKKYPRDPKDSHYRLAPWDALSAAALTENTELVSRFLPLASKINPLDQGRLLSLGLYSENREVTDRIRSKFPDADIKRWKPDKNSNDASANDDDESLRLLLPRTTPTPVRKTNSGSQQNVLAVIASPDAAGPGAILSAHASSMKGWSVVDRSEIQASLQESQIAMPWLDGRHSLSEFGDRVAADVLIIVSRIKGKTYGLYRFESVEVATGLEIHRAHYRDDAFDPDKDLQPFLARTVEELRLVRNNKRRQAVSLISFTASSELPNSSAIAKRLSSSIRSEIDSTPGFISLNRSQVNRLVEEQTLKGEQSVWGAAHMIEGAVTSTEDNQIKISLRLETFNGSDKFQHDIELTGPVANIPVLAAAAWDKFLVARNTKRSAQKQTHQQSKKEAERLMREAEWMMHIDINVKEIIPMLEAALALGAPTEKVMALHLDCLFRNVKHFNSIARSGADNTTRLADLDNVLVNLPISINYSDRMVDSLPKLEKLLQQTGFYFQQIGSDSLAGKFNKSSQQGRYTTNEFWYVIQFLSFCRAAVYTDLLSDQERQSFQKFGMELNQLTKTYFEMQVEINKSHSLKYRGDLYRMLRMDRYVLERNPEIGKGLASLVASGESMEIAFTDNFGYNSNDGKRVLVNALLKKTPEIPKWRRNLLQPEIDFILAPPHDRVKVYRRAMRLVAMGLAENRKSKMNGMVFMDMHLKHTLSAFFGVSYSLPLHHGSMVIPDLFHAPRASPDFLMRPGTYLKLLSQFGSINTLPPRAKQRALKHTKFLPKLSEMSAEQVRRDNSENIVHLRNAACVWDLTTGERVQESFTKVYRPYLKLPKKVKVTSVKAKLLADLRIDSHASPGFVYQPMRDAVNKATMWIRYYPYADGIVPISKGDGLKEVVRRQPWLLAVDCNDGTLEKKINLTSATGLPVNQTNPGGTIRNGIMPLVQTDNKILTNTNWLGIGDSGRSGKFKYPILIDKEKGSIKVLPPEQLISEGVHSNLDMCNIAVGDAFYTLQSVNRVGRPDIHRMARSLNRIDEQGEMHALTVYGRKPEKTPFDAADRWPKSIAKHGNKIMVTHNDFITGYYDPVTGSWKSLPENTPQENFTLMRNVKNEFVKADLAPNHRVNLPENGGLWRIDHQKLLPRALVISHPKHGVRHIQIDMTLPKGSVKHLKFTRSQNPLPGSDRMRTSILPYHEYIQKHPFHLVVVNQTKNHLVLALQFENTHMRKGGYQSNRFLPFLWKLQLSELTAMLDLNTKSPRLKISP